MYRIFSFVILLFIGYPFNSIHGQDTLPQSGLMVERVVEVGQLVRDVFIKEGSCSQVSNIKLIGRSAGVGAFRTAPGTIAVGIDSGLVISTGEVEDIVGPNQINNTTGIGAVNLGDPDLNLIAENQIFDATGIEFDFLPTSTQVTFSYVFASEEYCEFVDDDFNDVFGFFISGPGINGPFEDQGINLARIPNSDERLSISSVNHKKNSQFFIPNLLNTDLQSCGLPLNSVVLRDVEFDGLTVKLQASIEVVPCETYHIRIIIGDVGDNILDSGVFLEANSFDLGSLVEVNAEVINSEDNLLYEDCLEGNFVFERINQANRMSPLLVNYQINGTARNGEDFLSIDQQIIIQGGEDFARLPIKAIQDSFEEEIETIEIVTEVPSCDCIERDTAVLRIADQKSNLEVSFDEELACIGQTFNLEPQLLNAIPPLVYQWNTGDTSSALQATLRAPTSFSLTVSDACGAEASAEVMVGIQDPPIATLDGTTDWCSGQTDQFLSVAMEGNGPWSLSYAINNTQTIALADIQNNPFALPVNAVGDYELIAFSDKNCRGEVQGTGLVNNAGFELNPMVIFPSCQTASDGSIRLEMLGGVAPYLVQWDSSLVSEPLIENVGLGNYRALVVDSRGCMESSIIKIESNQVRESCNFSRRDIYTPNAFSPNGDNVNDVYTVYPRKYTFEAISFQMLDRWGNVLYESPEFNTLDGAIGWNGADAPIGVYLCKILVRLTDGRIQVMYQDVKLVR
ncbi:MAG: hypothetical protein Sapg2KO_06860 [Saprospiraceae bacterium]